jgi:hypothetical protein
VIVVAPRVNVLPEAGPAVRVIVAPEQLSLTVGAVHEATAVQAAPAFTLMLLGHAAITGTVTSCTVTVKVQRAEAFPERSVTWNETVWIPTGIGRVTFGPATCVLGPVVQLSVQPKLSPEMMVAVHVPGSV